MEWKNHIVTDDETFAGKPRIKGTRISVELILDRVADGRITEDILASYPNISREDVSATLSFAANNNNLASIAKAIRNF